MRYEYFIAAAVVWFLYLINIRLNEIVTSAKQTERYADIVRMEVEGLSARLSNLETSIQNSQYHLAQINDVTDEYRSLVLRARNDNF